MTSRFPAALSATRKFGFAALAISLLILSPIAFYSKSPLVFYRFDGTYLLIAAVMQKIWSASDWYFTTNPLQGIGGLELPQHILIEPGLWLTAHLPTSIGPTAAMTFYALLLAVSIFWLATRLGMAPLPTIFAAWLGPLLALPYVYPSLGFDFLWGAPTFIMMIALNTGAILLFLDLGRGPLLGDVARFLAIAAVCAYEFLQFPNFAPVSFVALAFFGVVAFLMAGSTRERLLKLDQKLANVLRGQAQVESPQDLLELAEFCRRHKQDPAAAVRFYAAAFAAQPALADDLRGGYRYHAACCAALAARGDKVTR